LTIETHQRAIIDGMFKHVRSFGKSKEKTVKIEGDSFHSTFMDVAKVTTNVRE
jgi:hypothetical protein